MRVAFFHDHRFRSASGAYYSNGGLSYKVFSRYLHHFDDLTVVGRVDAISGSSDLAKMTLASGPRVEMACIPSLSRWAMVAGSTVRRHIRDVVARSDCAIIRLPSLIGLTACREAIRARKPWMVEVVGCAWESYWHHGSASGRGIAPLLFALNRKFIRRAPYALYVSEKFLQRRFPSDGATVACSNVEIDPPDPAVLAHRLARIRAMFGAERRLRVGLVGSLDVDYKGHATALRALAVLRRQGTPIAASFLGSGEPGRWRKHAERLGVGTDVEFKGTLPAGRPVLEWMDSLDLLVAPSLTEGLPRALVEAMSRGLPSIGSRAGGIPELLGESWTHAARDWKRLASLMGRLLASPQEMEVAARRNFDTAGRYAVDVLDARRHDFLARFRDSVVTPSSRRALA